MLLGDEFCTYPAGYKLDNVLVCSDIRADGNISLTSNYGIDATNYLQETEDLYITIRTYGTKL